MHPQDEGRDAPYSTTNVRVAMTARHGRGLFASRTMAKGEVVLVERPLVAMQSLDNTRDVMVCRNCLGFVGSLVSQLKLLSGVPRHECLSQLVECDSANEQVPQNVAVISGIEECSQGCGEVYCSPKCRHDHFDRCHRLLCVGPIPEEEAPTHPLVAFRVHAMQTNEIFLLVGEVMARIVCSFHANGGDLEMAMTPFHDFVQEPWWEVAVAHSSMEKDRGRSSEYIAETGVAEMASGNLVSNEGLDTSSESFSVSNTDASLPHALRELCEQSCDLLRRALRPMSSLEEIFSAERFGRLVGMFEQNNVGIRVPFPVANLLRGVLSMSDSKVESGGRSDRFVSQYLTDEVVALVSNLTCEDYSDSDCDGCHEGKSDDCMPASQPKGKCCSVGPEIETIPAIPVKNDNINPVDGSGNVRDMIRGLDDSMFAPLDGTALYTLICCMNHSCRPNCLIRYPCGITSEDMRDNAVGPADALGAEIVLLENVDDGQELTQSYIDKEMGLVDRREALRDYGFLCDCGRCTEEVERA